MPYKKPKIEKHIYSIGEVAEMFGENVSLIRYWENEFPSLKPEKNKKGNRLFKKEDIEELGLIYHLVKEKGMTLEGARKQIRDNRAGSKKNYEVVKILQEIRQELVELRDGLENPESL